MVKSTGIGALDRKLGGGLPDGSLVAVEAPPSAQREPLLCAGLHLRPSLYLSTVRSETAIRKQLDRSPVEPKLSDFQRVTPERAPSSILNAIEGVDPGEDFILDVADPLERDLDPGTYAALLNTLSEQVIETDGVGYVHCYARDDAPENRPVTLDVADVVWQLSLVGERSNLTYVLEIPKINGMRVADSDRVLEIEVGQDVYVDETRNI